MELQKLSSEVSGCSFINVSVEVGGDTFIHGGQIAGNLAEKFCQVRVDTEKIYTIRMSTNREGKKHFFCERTSVDAKEIRGNSLAKVPDNDIEIGEATVVRFAKIRF